MEKSFLVNYCHALITARTRADIFRRAEKFAKEYQDQERDEIRYPTLVLIIWAHKELNASSPWPKIS